MTPIEDWNVQLQQCRCDVELKRKREGRLNRLNIEWERQKRAAEQCLQVFHREEHDVKELASSSFSQFWLGLFGKWDERLQAEEKQAAEAKLKYDAAQASIRAMEDEKAELLRQLAEVQDAENRLALLKAQKETWIRQHNQAANDELERLSEQMASTKARLVETEEAYRAGTNAQQALAEAEDKLSSARNWGTYDLLGGGMIATMVKHGKIDDAQHLIHQAQSDLRRFAEELQDLNWQMDGTAPQIGNFLKFSDYFFDGLIADWMVQGKINDSLESVQTHSSQVGTILQRLSQESRRLASDSAGYRTQFEQLIERYGT